MNQLERVFNYRGAGVRVILKDGEPLFVAADVCRILELGSASLAVNGRDRVSPVTGELQQTGGLDTDEKGAAIVSTPGGTQELIVVTEPGLYSLVFKSRKPEAKAFKRWVVHEVLPTIRKTGSYSIAETPTQALLKAVQIMAEQEQKISRLEGQQTVIQHRLDAIDSVDTIGDLQQRFNAMVRKYAHKRGVLFSIAWNEFVDAYNTAYHTNLKLLISNYKSRNGTRDLTTPQYLSITGKLEDAIRVADKMLN